MVAAAVTSRHVLPGLDLGSEFLLGTPWLQLWAIPSVPPASVERQLPVLSI
jgi:hypothetical protein